MPDDVDPELLVRFVRGDEAAFEQVYRLFGAEVRGWCLRILRDASAADEVTVDAFWRAFRARARFDPSRGFGPWIRRIATNAARDHLRAGRGWTRAASVARDVAAPAVSHDVADAVALALTRLPPRLRVIATLALIEEQPYAEIADALGIPLGTVKSRVFRATRALRAELAALGVLTHG